MPLKSMYEGSSILRLDSNHSRKLIAASYRLDVFESLPYARKAFSGSGRSEHPIRHDFTKFLKDLKGNRLESFRVEGTACIRITDASYRKPAHLSLGLFEE